MTREQMLNEINFSKPIMLEAAMDSAQEKIGEKVLTSSGIELELIAYISSNQVYYIRDNEAENFRRSTYGNFVRLGVSNKDKINRLKRLKQEREGLTTESGGCKYMLIDYIDARNITVLNLTMNETRKIEYQTFVRWQKVERERKIKVDTDSYARFEVIDSNGVKHLSRELNIKD